MTERLQKYEQFRDLDKIATLPKMRFPSHWEIQIIPPFGGAAVRFRVSSPRSQNIVSVYLDTDNSLGWENGPYWEIFSCNDNDTERFAQDDWKRLKARIKNFLKRYPAP